MHTTIVCQEIEKENDKENIVKRKGRQQQTQGGHHGICHDLKGKGSKTLRSDGDCRH
jgi:hypothetical protein